MKVFCVDNTLNKNILESQLLTPLKLIIDEDFMIVLPEKYRHEAFVEIFESKLVYYENAKQKYKLIRNLNAQKIYTRSVIEFLSFFLLKKVLFKKWTLIYDFRGIAYAESILNNGENFRNKILKGMEKFAYKKADELLTVSDKFVEFLEKEFKMKRKIKVTPCCVDESTIRLKHFEDQKTELNFLYLGSVKKYQKFDEIIELFKQIAEKIQNTRFTILTNDVNIAREKCDKLNIKATIKSLPQSEISKELITFDFGFLLRDNIAVNNVASPVKFLEYISNGVIPIMSEGIGDYSDIVKAQKIGIIYNNDLETLIEEIERTKGDNKIHERIFELVNHYTWNKYINNFKE